MKKLIRFLSPIAIASVLGPLIAGLAVSVFAFGYDMLDDTGPLLLADMVQMSTFYIIFAYVMGGPIAALAGILVSIWMIWRTPNLIVVMAAAAAATCLFMGVGALGFLGPVEWTNARSNFSLNLALALVSAACSWFLTRRFARAI
jgi:hypothetical protein